MTRRAFLTLLLSALPAWAAPPKVPPKVEVAVGEDYVLEFQLPDGAEFGVAKGFTAKSCTFFGPVKAGNTYQFLVRPKRAGEFVVSFWAKGETAASQTVIAAGGGGGDDVTPPAPTDPFVKALLAAFVADPSPTKVTDCKALAGVYRELARPGQGVWAAGVATEQQLMEVIVAARASVVGERLEAVRTAVAEQYAGAFTGTPAAPVSQAQRQRVADALAKAAAVLEVVK